VTIGFTVTHRCDGERSALIGSEAWMP
jgi:hypothetical protein